MAETRGKIGFCRVIVIQCSHVLLRRIPVWSLQQHYNISPETALRKMCLERIHFGDDLYPRNNNYVDGKNTPLQLRC